MATIEEIHKQCIHHLVQTATQVKSVASADNAMLPSLNKLIHALPHYKKPEWRSIYRESLANLLAVNLPNSGIPLPPNESQSGFRSTVRVTYTHGHPYTGYRDVFFPGVNRTPSAAAVASAVLSVDSSLNDDWWGKYAVAALTGEIRQKVAMNLNAAKLDLDLTNNLSKFLPALSASYLAVFQSGYPPTMEALKQINKDGQAPKALSELSSFILHQGFIANISYMLGEEDLDNWDAVVWYLFNLWITLKALGAPNVDDYISEFQKACKNYPSESIGASKWWNGGYTTWSYSPLYGDALWHVAKHAIAAAMPLIKTKETISSASMFGATPKEVSPHSIPNGYSQSFCYHGPLSWYKA